MTIFYLQQVNVLPVLDERVVRPGVTLVELEKYFQDINGREYEGEKTVCIAELVAGFYKFYSNYNWDNWISIRSGRSLAPVSFLDQKNKILIRIEEPFEGTNTARSVHTTKFDLIKNVIDEVALIASNQRNLHMFIDEVKQGLEVQPKVPQIIKKKAKRTRKQKEERVRSLDRWVESRIQGLH